VIPGYSLPKVNRPVRLQPSHLPQLAKRELVIQPKLDGWRVLAGFWKGAPGVLSRTGKQVKCAQSLWDRLRLLPEGTVLDGELIGETLHVFDLLYYDTDPHYKDSFRSRHDQLLNIVDKAASSHLESVKTTLYLPKDGAEWLDHLLKPIDGEEGRVIKGWKSYYTDPWYKKKFVSQLTGILIKSEGESGKVALWKDATYQELIEICGLKIPVGLPVGTLIEVEYLMVGKHTRLVQPILKTLRHDVDSSECTFDHQLGVPYAVDR
jgi:ATP-dependent DNA ligase